MTIPVLDVPLTVALAAMATIGYIVGRRSRVARQGTDKPSQLELKRAEAVVRDLESISQQVRINLAEHHSSLLSFKSRVTELSKSADPASCRELANEAERVLKPTLMLSKQISLAYEEIRQQTGLLLNFTELRTDPLTGINNRRALDEVLQSRFAMRSRYQAPFSVLISDVDHFKQINDQYGHAHGDDVLQAVANILKNEARETDVVTRYGGEEFVVVCPETDLHGTCIFAERVRAAVERELSVTVSIGVAMALDGDTSRSLLARADTALYSAKAGGRNRVYHHNGHHILPYNANDEQAELATHDDHEFDPKTAGGRTKESQFITAN